MSELTATTSKSIDTPLPSPPPNVLFRIDRIVSDFCVVRKYTTTDTFTVDKVKVYTCAMSNTGKTASVLLFHAYSDDMKTVSVTTILKHQLSNLVSIINSNTPIDNLHTIILIGLKINKNTYRELSKVLSAYVVEFIPFEMLEYPIHEHLNSCDYTKLTPLQTIQLEAKYGPVRLFPKMWSSDVIAILYDFRHNDVIQVGTYIQSVGPSLYYRHVVDKA